MHLRPLEPEDLQLLYTIENDEALWDTSDTDAPFSRFALKEYIAKAAPIHECGQLRLVIDLKKEFTSNAPSQAVGLVDLTNYSPINARAEVGITLLKKYRGQGYGHKALQSIEQFAKQRLRIHTLYSYVSPNNTASYQLFEKSGYKLIAKLPDWCYKGGKYEETALFLKIF